MDHEIRQVGQFLLNFVREDRFGGQNGFNQPKMTFHRIQEISNGNRLDEKSIRTCLGNFLADFWVGLAGDEDHFHIGTILAHLAHQLDP